jgi:hypothetical protein
MAGADAARSVSEAGFIADGNRFVGPRAALANKEHRHASHFYVAPVNSAINPSFTADQC